MSEKIQESFIDHIMAGMEGITKHSSHNLMRIKFRHFNHNYLKPLFNKEVPQTKAKKVLEVYHTISVAEALDQIGNEVDVNQKKPLVSTGASNVYRRTPSGFVNSGFRGESMANEQLETSNQNESGSVNTEGSPIIYKCVEDPVVRETVIMERPRTSPPVGGGSNTAEKGTANGEDSEEFENVTITFKQPLDNAVGVEQNTEISDFSSESFSYGDTMSEPSTITYANEEETPNTVTPLELPLPWKTASHHSNIETHDVVTNSELPNGELPKAMEPVGTAAESFFPWRNFPRDPIPFSTSLAYSDDSAPVVAEAPTWVNNLSYSHLKESGSPYASPEMTLIPVSRHMHTSVFDVFKTDQIGKCLDACVAKLQTALDETDSKSHQSGDTLPPPWSHHNDSVDDLPVPSMIDNFGVKNKLLMSNHTAPPPSHHVILPTVHFSGEGSVSQSHSDDGETPRQLKSLPGSASAPDLPKHFQLIEPMTKSRLHSESMLEDLDFHDQAVSRVNEWLSATISEEDGIVIPIHVPTPELSSDNDADCSSEGEGDDDEGWDFDRDDL